MKKIILLTIFFLLLISFVSCADWTPPGNINLRDYYNITGAPYVNATMYYGNGSQLSGIISDTASTANSSSYWDNLDTFNTTQMENEGGKLTILLSYLISLFYTESEVDNINTSMKNYVDFQNTSQTNYMNYLNISNNNYIAENNESVNNYIIEVNTSVTNTFGNYYTKTESNLINDSNNNYIVYANNTLVSWVDLLFPRFTELIDQVGNFSAWDYDYGDLINEPTHLSNFTDNLGDRGYTHLTNFTNNLNIGNWTQDQGDYYTSSEVDDINTSMGNYVVDYVGIQNTSLVNYIGVQNTSMKNYVDSQDVLFNDSVNNYIAENNASVNNYIAEVNTSMKNYVDDTFLTEETNWNANYTNMQENCSSGYYAVGFYSNGTIQCVQESLSSESDPYWSANYTAYNESWSNTYNATTNTSITNFITSNNESVNNYILYVNGTAISYVDSVNSAINTSNNNYMIVLNDSNNNYILYANETMKDYADAVNTAINTSNNNYALVLNTSNNNYIVFINSTMKSYVDAMDISFNDSMNNWIVQNNNSVVNYINFNNQSIANTFNLYVLISELVDKVGNWSADSSDYYTSSQVDDINTSVNNYISDVNTSVTNTFGNYYTKTEADDINTSVNNYIAENNASVENYILYVNSTNLAEADTDTHLTEEEVEDYAGGMWTGNTETGVDVTYQDGDGTIDVTFDCSDVIGDGLTCDLEDLVFECSDVQGDHITCSDSNINVNDDWYNSIYDIPNATPSDGDTTHFSTADHIYDFVDTQNASVKNYADSQDVLFNNSVNNYILENNNSVNNYILYVNSTNGAGVGISWETAMNGTLFQTSNWNATNNSYLEIKNWNATNESYMTGSNFTLQNISMQNYVLYVNSTNPVGGGSYDDSWINGTIDNKISTDNSSINNWVTSVFATIANLASKVSWTDLWNQVYNETEVNNINTSMKNYVDWLNTSNNNYISDVNTSIEARIWTNVTASAWINPEHINDVDDADIETDLNTYVDIDGDIMTGNLNMTSNNNITMGVNQMLCLSYDCTKYISWNGTHTIIQG